MGNQGQMVRKYMAMRLKQWENEPNDARVKGELAQLRHGIGKKPVGLSGRYLFPYACMLCISREVIFIKITCIVNSNH